MCDQCAKLDKKIDHYETILVSIGDRVTVTGLWRWSQICGRKKRRFIRSKSRNRPPQLAASFISVAAAGIRIGNSNCCSSPNRCAIFVSYSNLSDDDSAISKTLPRCLPSTYGSNATEVAKYLILREIDDLTRAGVLNPQE
jgi:hypothetical protein